MEDAREGRQVREGVREGRQVRGGCEGRSNSRVVAVAVSVGWRTRSDLIPDFSARSTLVRTNMVRRPSGLTSLTTSVTILRSASREPSGVGESHVTFVRSPVSKHTNLECT